MDNNLEQQIRQIVQDEIANQAMSSLNCPYHQHTQTDVGQLDASKSLINSPQSKLTTASGGSLSTGGAAVLTSADAAILNNAITRIADLETKLTTIGLLKTS